MTYQSTLQNNNTHTVKVGGMTVKNVIFLCNHGSHLYGTETEQSDLDLKGVFVSPLDKVILGNDKRTHNISTGGENQNTSDDLDVEFIEVRKFIEDAKNGQTYAIELLNCDNENRLLTTEVWKEIGENKDRLFTSDVKAFVGYCKHQAKKYGTKGARLKATEEAYNTLKNLPQDELLKDHLDALDFNEYVGITTNEEDELLEINQKKFNLGVKIRDVLEPVKATIDKYGDRSRQARDGVDWKAISHAYRVGYQLIEYLKTGSIQFPLKKADFIKKVKKGEIKYEKAQKEIPQLIKEAEAINSDLPDSPDNAFWNNFLTTLYRELDQAAK